ncbi:GyrI-like domain-containing protein [Gillisia sp. M10.2A]|uniref:GyrI-like domain-containing protein n=1 Tax=Gillisia lutea TaxID=2909668 RepID=A0ABS9EGS4_9FLAO|nr:GyrI-like domain-containing protein [Gillisia lutea]MCF4102070.1 GyrI-like domain-containing protein [Gillisia lutea]
MKILKYLFFLLLIAIIAGAIYIATKDGNYQVEESAVIAAPVSVVFNEVNNFKNWENWGPWMDDSDDMIITYSDTLSGEGANYSWKSEEMGDGKIRTQKVIPNSSIDQKITFITPYGTSKSDVYWNFEEIEEGTKVTWGMKGKQSFMEKLAFSFKDSSFTEMMRPMFTEGLDKLNTVTINKMDVHSINVDGITQFGGGFYMYTTTATKIGQIQVKMQQMFTEVSNYMESNNIPKIGNPFVLYNKWDEENGTAIYSTGIFTESLVITPADSNVLNGMMPMQKVLKVTLKGDYKYLKDAWNEAYKYLNDNALLASEEQASFELYKTNPNDVANPANFITEIYIPLRETQAPEASN